MLQVKKELNEKQAEQLKKINAAIDLMTKDKDIIDIVKKIEGKIATTKGHYGDYMAFLSNFKDMTMLYIMSEALKNNGADQYGVDWAINLLKNRF